ncbi:hypothetical protein KKA39_03120 [Patescibacteria group bacterium]|nr:hypothetical protein [Patescibacteria group bacterium]MBU1728267.1 hypothetical protein [Patescibacteria group bacterium]
MVKNEVTVCPEIDKKEFRLPDDCLGMIEHGFRVDPWNYKKFNLFKSFSKFNKDWDESFCLDFKKFLKKNSRDIKVGVDSIFLGYEEISGKKEFSLDNLRELSASGVINPIEFDDLWVIYQLLKNQEKGESNGNLAVHDKILNVILFKSCPSPLILEHFDVPFSALLICFDGSWCIAKLDDGDEGILSQSGLRIFTKININ